MITGHGGGAVRVWDLLTGEQLAHYDDLAKGVSVNHLVLLPDGVGLVVGHNRGCSYWRLVHNSDGYSLNLARPSIGPSTMLSAGRHLIGHLNDGRAVLDIESPLVYQLNIKGGPTRRWVMGQPTRMLTRGALHHDGRTLALSDNLGTIRIWNLDELEVLPFVPPWTGNRFGWGRQPKLAGEPIIRLPTGITGGSGIGALQFTPDGSRLLAAIGDVMTVWDAATWECVNRLTISGQHVRTATLSPDGRTILAAGSDSEVCVFDVDSGCCRGRFSFEVGKISRLAFAPDGLTATACGGGLRVAIWDVD